MMGQTPHLGRDIVSGWFGGNAMPVSEEAGHVSCGPKTGIGDSPNHVPFTPKAEIASLSKHGVSD